MHQQLYSPVLAFLFLMLCTVYWIERKQPLLKKRALENISLSYVPQTPIGSTEFFRVNLLHHIPSLIRPVRFLLTEKRDCDQFRE